MQDVLKSMGDMHGELKGMLGGIATKDASRVEELMTLKAQQTDLTKRIVIIEGNQPATFLPEELAHALKSTGPQVLEGSKPGPVVPTDPSRPLAALGAATFPLLYSEDGWQLPAS